MKLSKKKALDLISRYCPCEHLTVDKSLGNGKIWCKCEDCGETILQEHLVEYRINAENFADAIQILREE